MTQEKDPRRGRTKEPRRDEALTEAPFPDADEASRNALRPDQGGVMHEGDPDDRGAPKRKKD